MLITRQALYKSSYNPIYTTLATFRSSPPPHLPNMTILGALGGMVGYETIPPVAKDKGFYDLQASLPGKDKVYDFVSCMLKGAGRWG